MIFDTQANILNHIEKRQLEGTTGVVDVYHIPNQLEGNISGGIWTYFTNLDHSLPIDFGKSILPVLEELKQSDNIQIVKSRDDWDDQSLNVVLGIKGLSVVREISQLEQIYQLGFRHASLTRELGEKNHLVSDFQSSLQGGLTDLGYEAIKKMNDFGMVIDVTNASEQMIENIQGVTSDPVIASSSNCYGLTPGINNLTDEQIKFIAQTDGFVGVSAVAKQLSTPTVEAFVDHIDYLKKLVGIRHISLGFNFMDYLNSDNLHLHECGNVSQAGNIIDELLRRNYNTSEVEAITSINAKRVINCILKD